MGASRGVVRRDSIRARFPRAVKRVLAGSRSAPRAPLSVADAWSGALEGEVRFWDKRLHALPEKLAPRGDPTLPLQDDVAALIVAPPGSTVRILDAGAGPLTFLGKVHPLYTLEITAVDVLADQYNASLDAAGIVPPVRTRRCETERLSDLFPAGHFDVGCARNTLDHSYDPVAGIRELLACVKPGGAVLLEHARNVAEKERYLGMHQWNFLIEDDELVVWRPGERTELSAVLAGVATVEKTWTTPTKTPDHPLGHVVLRKHRAVP